MTSEALDQLHVQVGAFLTKHPFYAQDGKDESGSYKYVGLFSTKEPTLGGLKVGKYDQTGWTFIDLPFSGRMMLKHLMYDLGRAEPNQWQLDMAQDVVGRLGIDLEPVLRA